MDYCNPYWQPIWYPLHPQWQVDINFSSENTFNEKSKALSILHNAANFVSEVHKQNVLAKYVTKVQVIINKNLAEKYSVYLGFIECILSSIIESHTQRVDVHLEMKLRRNYYS
jgi:hypothetical protein